MKSRSPFLGYNHNIRYGGRMFHVQTEDSGVNNPHIFTHLFHEGTILASKRADYRPDDDDNTVQRMMQAQHKLMLKELKHGTFDAKISQFFGAAVAELAETQPFQKAEAPSEPQPPPLESTLPERQPFGASVDIPYDWLPRTPSEANLPLPSLDDVAPLPPIVPPPPVMEFTAEPTGNAPPAMEITAEPTGSRPSPILPAPSPGARSQPQMAAPPKSQPQMPIRRASDRHGVVEGPGSSPRLQPPASSPRVQPPASSSRVQKPVSSPRVQPPPSSSRMPPPPPPPRQPAASKPPSSRPHVPPVIARPTVIVGGGSPTPPRRHTTKPSGHPVIATRSPSASALVPPARNPSSTSGASPGSVPSFGRSSSPSMGTTGRSSPGVRGTPPRGSAPISASPSRGVTPPPRRALTENIFGEDPDAEKSLDEVILAYLAEDPPRK